MSETTIANGHVIDVRPTLIDNHCRTRVVAITDMSEIGYRFPGTPTRDKRTTTGIRGSADANALGTIAEQNGINPVKYITPIPARQTHRTVQK